jgi:hypothetical protein
VIEGQLAAKAVVLKPATRKETTTIFINIFFIFTSVNKYSIIYYLISILNRSKLDLKLNSISN